jgi:hypothetical protein
VEAPNITGVLRLLDSAQTEGPINVDEASFFLSKLELTSGTAPTMPKWRKRLFIATSMFSTDASVYFGLPPEPHGHHGRTDRDLANAFVDLPPNGFVLGRRNATLPEQGVRSTHDGGELLHLPVCRGRISI